MLLFKECFRAPILRGTKTVTRRGTRRTFNVDSVHQAYTRPPFCRPAGEPFARLQIVAVEVSQLRDVDHAEALREGFSGLDGFWEYLRQYDGGLTPSSELLRVEFRLVR